MERNKLARQIIDTCLEMTCLGLNQGQRVTSVYVIRMGC